MSSGTHTPSALNTEEDVFVSNLAAGRDGEIHAKLDLANMVAGDVVEIRVKSKIDGANYREEDVTTLTGAQTRPYLLSHAWTDSAQDLKVTLRQTAGGLRAFPWRNRVVF